MDTEFYIPSLAELVDANRRELFAAAPDTLRRSDGEAFARMVAGAEHGLYAYMGHSARQLLPHTAGEAMLEAFHIPFWLEDGKRPAAAARGELRLRGLVGAPVPTGSEWRSESGVVVRVVTGQVLPASGVADVPVEAVQAGAGGNLPPGSRFGAVQPLEGVESAAQCVAGLSGGADAESVESARARVLERARRDGESGRAEDFESWAKEVPGVARAWTAPRWGGFGVTTVFFTMSAGAGERIPTADEVATVTAHLRATATPFGEIYAAAPRARPIAVTLSLSPDTPELRADVERALAEAIRRVAAPLDVARRQAGLTAGVVVRRSWLDDAVSTVPGETFHAISQPSGDVTCEVGELAMLGAVTWPS